MFPAVVGQSWASAAHPHSIEINGVDRTSAIALQSVNIEMGAPGTNGSMSFAISDPTASIIVNTWDEVRFLEHGAGRPARFGGFVQSVRYQAWATTGRDIAVTCVGYGILLDRKVIGSFLANFGDIGRSMCEQIGRWGGMLEGICGANGTAPAVDRTIATQTNPYYWAITIPGYWQDGYANGATLRAWFDESVATSTVGLGGGPEPPLSGVMWVDASRRVNILPTNMPDVHPDGDVGEYTGGATITINVASPVAGRSLEYLEYEREDTDRITAGWVEGSNPAGTGLYYTPGLERVGDLVGVISASESAGATEAIAAMQAEVERSEGLSVEVRAVLSSSSALDVWPGMKATVTAAQLGLSGQVFRVNGVSLSFRIDGKAVYDVRMGAGNVGRRLSSRTGRYAKRQAAGTAS